MSKIAAHRVGGNREGNGADPVSMEATARFGIFELDPRRRELRRKGVRVPLQQQPLALLHLLLARQGDIVSREQIEQTLWPDDRIIDFERSINTAIRKLRRALRDDAGAPTYIETVPRAGYRLMIPVTGGTEKKQAPCAIGVLPLRDLTGTPDPRHFVDGLTDALITELARGTRLRVVSRCTMSRYKDSQQSLPEIARELNVQAVVEGSVLRSENRIRISARLLDATEDRHLWAQAYDRNLQDTFRLSDEIADAIASSAAQALSDRASSCRPS